LDPKAVMVAEETTGRLREREVDIAEHRLEVDKSTELINVLATQQKIALQACYSLFRKGTPKVTTGQAYEIYQTICANQNYRSLTQRRFCDMISFLDLYGLINARVVSMGRYGKTREIMSSLPDPVIENFL
jgi:cell division control protein 6